MAQFGLEERPEQGRPADRLEALCIGRAARLHPLARRHPDGLHQRPGPQPVGQRGRHGAVQRPGHAVLQAQLGRGGRLGHALRPADGHGRDAVGPAAWCELLA
jgi:hypothetical protein